MINRLFAPYLIYKVLDSTGSVVYVGKTQRLLPIRFKALCKEHSLNAASFKIRLIEKVIGNKEALKQETYWINYYIQSGCTLLNTKQIKK